MIRRSTAIATAAILLSLLVHFIGLGFTSAIQPNLPPEDVTNDVVALGTAFEDLAETLSEPVPPEKTPPPDPPTETAPEPELANTPTSKVLVASANPQRTSSPDTGAAQVVQPDTTGSPKPEQGRIPEPGTTESTEGDQKTTVDVAVTPPVEPETIAEAPKGNPDARAEPVEVATAEPVLGSPAAPAPQPLAALSVPVTPDLTVTPVPVPSAIPVIPPERETITPETPETTVESNLAVVASLRPRVSTLRPSTEPMGLSDGSAEFNELLFPPLIESPLAADQRDRTDLITRQNGRAQTGGPGFLDSRGPGNSDVTNYAGLVLVHLNRASPVRVSARGAARIFLEINADGTLARVDIIDSTGSQEIERAAKAQIRRAAPYPRPPQGASYRLTFVYRSN